LPGLLAYDKITINTTSLESQNLFLFHSLFADVSNSSFERSGSSDRGVEPKQTVKDRKNKPLIYFNIFEYF
jgi:hypothetical protein